MSSAMCSEPVGDGARVTSDENFVCRCGLEMKLRSITDRKNEWFGRQLWLCPKEKGDPTQCNSKRVIDVVVRDDQQTEQIEQRPKEPQTPKRSRQKRMDSFFTPSTLRSNRKSGINEGEQGRQIAGPSNTKRPPTPTPLNRGRAKKSKTDPSLLRTPDSTHARPFLREGPFRSLDGSKAIGNESPCLNKRIRSTKSSDSAAAKTNRPSSSREDIVSLVALAEEEGPGDMLRIGSRVIPVSEEVKAFLKAAHEALSAAANGH